MVDCQHPEAKIVRLVITPRNEAEVITIIKLKKIFHDDGELPNKTLMPIFQKIVDRRGPSNPQTNIDLTNEELGVTLSEDQKEWLKQQKQEKPKPKPLPDFKKMTNEELIAYYRNPKYADDIQIVKYHMNQRGLDVKRSIIQYDDGSMAELQEDGSYR